MKISKLPVLEQEDVWVGLHPVDEPFKRSLGRIIGVALDSGEAIRTQWGKEPWEVEPLNDVSRSSVHLFKKEGEDRLVSKYRAEESGHRVQRHGASYPTKFLLQQRGRLTAILR